jgi:alkanesulfonate monooxygenase SsuD/methylene tetrahydromethanopterin reductase-like flavin-dependent oxidoreductase (luciferase family)
MRFGYFMPTYQLNGEQSYRELLLRAGAETQLAERLGFSEVWLAEHHFGGEGWDIAPNPIMTGAYLANLTERIRIGLAAVILPNWHPLRVAEDVALLDHMTNGRVEVGVGRGITNRELTNLNLVGADRRDPDRNWAYFLESVEILKKAWTEESFTWEGEFFNFPAKGVKDSYAAWWPRDPRWRNEDDEYVGMTILPKPLQRPYPPLWNTVDRTPGFKVAAEHGMRPIAWLRSTLALREAFEVYRDSASEVQGRELRIGEDCALLRTCFVAETMEEARRIAGPAIEQLYGGYLGGIRARSIYAEPGETLAPAEPGDSWWDFLYERDHLFVGTPESVAEQLARVRDTAGLEHLLMFNWLPGVSAEQSSASLELFAEQVMPQFSADPEPVAGS